MSQPFNPWNYKPWWCQPWSIALTGTLIIGGSWMLTKIIWLTVAIALPVSLWMGFFLLVWPKLMQRMAIEASELDRSSGEF
jgi:hypothetical protein